MTYFSGETPMRGDVVQRVAECEDDAWEFNGNECCYGSLAYVRFVYGDGYIKLMDGDKENPEWINPASRYSLVSRGKP